MIGCLFSGEKSANVYRLDSRIFEKIDGIAVVLGCIIIVGVVVVFILGSIVLVL